MGLIDRTPEALESVIAIRELVEPNPEMSCAYATLFDIYRDADAALRSIDAQLHAFELQ